MNLADPQQWNAYAYANNNPITNSDPTGAIPEECTHIDCDYAPGCESCNQEVKKKNPCYPVKCGSNQDPDNPKGYRGHTRDGAPAPDNEQMTLAWGIEYFSGHHISNLTAAEIDHWSREVFCTYLNPDVCKEMLKAANAAWAGLLKELTGYNDAKDCYKGSALGCGFTALFFTPFKLLKVLKVGENITDAVRAACSFSGDTQVLMADGTTKPIDEVRVGDEVMATDPGTGEQGPRKVTHVWIHEDRLTDLVLDSGAVVTTTEDHPFWNATDHQWQRADSLGAGEILLGPNGRQTQVVGLRYGPALSAPAYNLTVVDIHTYYVLAGTTPVLVHNTGCGITFGGTQLQKKFKHASDFGVNGNYSKANGKAFEDALEAHVHDPSTTIIRGTYRGDAVTHYYNPNTGNNVIVDASGNFVSGWKLGPAQTQNLLTHGGLN
jgi:hypothetical protein